MVAAAVLVGGQWIGQAAAQHNHGGGGHQATGTTQTIRGEVVDMSCYIGHSARGAAHKQCAETCLKKGLPMGILTGDGKLYLLLEDHSKADVYQSLKNKAVQTVAATGKVVTKDGIKGIVVTAVQ
jgi:hypothetical protein